MTISINTKKLPIKLGQFLKLANIAQDGIMAKHLILNGYITINGVTSTQRGKKLYGGDIIAVEDGETYELS